ncbi:MAG: TetR/AcrR family transcriptional regulator, partial [Pseudomonadota bacterium]|nr:TetR/AcrR family transcriptional regulator [Pseudomonadota bacterium]
MKTHSLSKKALKRDSIVAEAINQINERGISFLSLNSVAMSMGLSRNTLYYYFKNREDLIYSCYLLAAEATAEDLQTAALSEKPGAAQIFHFVSSNLERKSAAIGDLTQLSPKHRSVIHDLKRKNEQMLQAMIQRGIEQEQFRNVSPVIATQVLMSFVSWHQLSGRWFNTPKTDPRKDATAEKISDMLLYGICRNPDFKFRYQINFQVLQAPEFNAFNTDSLNEEKRRQLIGQAAQLFNQRGIDAVSLEDIARFIGTSKGAVYHYFKDKPSLIRACYESAFKQYDQIIEAAIALCPSDLEALLSVNHLNCQAQSSRFPPLILQPGEAVFYDDYHSEVSRLAEKIQELRRRCFRNKSLRDISEESIELSSGAHSWISQWLGENSSEVDQWDSIALSN